MRVALLLIVLLMTTPAVAQPCAGDCDGSGAVAIDELITGVRIALGDAPVTACAAFDANADGSVGIEELVRAVTAALSGCPAAPTPTATLDVTATPTVEATTTPESTTTPQDTATPEATVTPIATASATPTIPPIDGSWVEAALTVTGSTCDESIACDDGAMTFTCFFQGELADRGPCEQEVLRTGDDTVRVSDCSGQVVDGELAADGTIRLVFPPASEGDGCIITLPAVTATVATGTSPITAVYTFDIEFSGAACPLPACTITAAGEWTRPSENGALRLSASPR